MPSKATVESGGRDSRLPNPVRHHGNSRDSDHARHRQEYGSDSVGKSATHHEHDFAQEHRLSTLVCVKGDGRFQRKATFGKRAAAAVFTGRDGKLPSAQDTPAASADLELVTWLVIADFPPS